MKYLKLCLCFYLSKNSLSLFSFYRALNRSLKKNIKLSKSLKKRCVRIMRRANQNFSQYSNEKCILSNEQYVGPKALFDPKFIPSRLYERQKEQRYLEGLINDAVEDEFPTQISLYGLLGSGKTAIVNKTIQKILDLNSEIPENEFPFINISINCEGKTQNQVLFSLVNKFAKVLNYELTPTQILNADFERIWSLFKFLSSKITKPIILFMDNIENINSSVFNKIIETSLNEKIILVNSFNIHQSSPFLMDFKKPDFKIQMDSYSKKSLFNISKSRCDVAFKKPVNNDMVQYIVDLVCQFDRQVPGSTIRVLRELFPIIEDGNFVDSDRIRDSCRFQFEGFSMDEITLAEYINESELLDKVFLDNVSRHFKGSENYYITHENLKLSYDIACESMEYTKKFNEFTNMLSKLEKISLLLPSFFSNKTVKNPLNSLIRQDPIINKQVLPNSLYDLTIPPEFLTDILDFAFGTY